MFSQTFSEKHWGFSEVNEVEYHAAYPDKGPLAAKGYARYSTREDIDKLYKEFQAQAVLLPEDMKKKKEQEIVDAEKDAKTLQRTRFGKDGDLFKKRQEFVKPIQEKIYNAIQDIATSNNYAVIFDKGGSLSILFANPKYDISDEVLDKLGASLSGRKSRTGKPGDNSGGKTNEPPPSGGKK